MPQIEQQRSEVRALLEQIAAEYEAAQAGLKGLSLGASQHQFITARVERMGQLYTHLQSLVGNAAPELVVSTLDKA